MIFAPVYKPLHHSIIDLGFHPGKTPLSQNNAYDKAIANHNQLRLDFRFSPWNIRHRTPHMLQPPLPMRIRLLQVKKHQAKSSLPRRLGPPLTFFSTVITIGIETPACLMVTTDNEPLHHAFLKPHSQKYGAHNRIPTDSSIIYMHQRPMKISSGALRTHHLPDQWGKSSSETPSWHT
jgi:hypothetical protein